jgi:hypothetical protein
VIDGKPHQMTSKNDTTTTEANLARRTLRTIALLVGACVIFVGALSVVAVAVASRAVGTGTQAGARDTDPTVKKPLSI